MKDTAIRKRHEGGPPLSPSSLLYLFVVFWAAVFALMLSISFQLNWKESLVSAFTAAMLTFFLVFTIVEMRRIGATGITSTAARKRTPPSRIGTTATAQIGLSIPISAMPRATSRARLTTILRQYTDMERLAAAAAWSVAAVNVPPSHTSSF